MSGDRIVGWTALFVAGWLAGNWTSGREVLGQGAQSSESLPTFRHCPARTLKLETLPDSRKAAKAWAKRYLISRKDGVILK